MRLSTIRGIATALLVAGATAVFPAARATATPSSAYGFTYLDQCDGSVQVGVVNAGREALSFWVDYSDKEERQLITVEPAGTKLPDGRTATGAEVLKVKPDRGIETEVGLKGEKLAVSWHTWKPCKTPGNNTAYGFVYLNSCDGSVRIGVVNAGPEPVTFLTYYSQAKSRRQVTVGPGGGHLFRVIPTDRIEIQVTRGDTKLAVSWHTWQTCPRPPASPPPAELPITGTHAGGLAGLAAVLLGIGGVGLYGLRSRRRRFIA